MVSPTSAAGTANSLCTGLSCWAEEAPQVIKEGMRVLNDESIQVQACKIAMKSLNYSIESLAPYAPHFSACIGGLFFTSSFISLAQPKAGSYSMLAKIVICSASVAFAYNKQEENLVVLSQLFLGSALAMALQRIKTLENEAVTREENRKGSMSSPTIT